MKCIRIIPIILTLSLANGLIGPITLKAGCCPIGCWAEPERPDLEITVAIIKKDETLVSDSYLCKADQEKNSPWIEDKKESADKKYSLTLKKPTVDYAEKEIRIPYTVLLDGIVRNRSANILFTESASRTDSLNDRATISVKISVLKILPENQ